jgi:hypothetical protein
MKVLNVATHALENTAQAEKLWPFLSAEDEAYAYNYLFGDTGVAIVIVDRQIDELTPRQNSCMKLAVVQALDAAGVEYADETVQYAGPTSRAIIDIALKLGDIDP